MRFLNVLAAAFLALALTGCAAQKMSQEDRAQADTTMTIQVFQYGLTGVILAGDTRFPQMAAEFKLGML